MAKHAEPRMMRNSYQTIKVRAFGMNSMGWEYYFIDDPEKHSYPLALVQGFAEDMGSVDVKGDGVRIMAQGAAALRATNTMPASGWEWVD